QRLYNNQKYGGSAHDVTPNPDCQKTCHAYLNTRPAGLEDNSHMPENTKGKLGRLKDKLSFARKTSPVDIP
ncbi:hypothetical protein ACONW8_004485, partial [Yersinia enterocolitica]